MRRSMALLVILGILIVGIPFTATAQTPQTILDVLEAVNIDSLMLTVAHLSGHESYTIDGQRDSMFTRSEMKKGLADPHDEARRMVQPCIDITGNVHVARSCGIDVPTGQTKINRNQATKMWKILGRLCDERTNVEYLRKDRNTGVFHPDVPLHEMV